MKKRFRSVLALGLAAAMSVGGMVVPAAAEESTAEQIVIGLDSDWNDISPFGTMSSMRAGIMREFYEMMAVRKDFGATVEDMVMECAKSITKVDDLTYDVEMYDNIVDSEGNAITAADYAWSAMTMKEMGNYEKLTSYLESVEAVDDYTAEIKLSDNPLGTIEYVLDIVPVISQAAYEASGDGMAKIPVATGPYKVTEMVPGSTLVLEKNENYWNAGGENPMGAQNVDKIVYKVVTEAAQMATALQTGDVDIAEYMDTTAIGTFLVDGQAADGYTVEQLNSNMMFTLLPNMSENSVLSQSKELREAIYTAIDAASCMQAATGGYGSVLHAMANPLSADYNSAWDERAYYEYDPDAAKALLEASGVDLSGTTLKILTMPAFNLDKVAVVIQALLAEVGVNSEVVSVEDALYQTYKLDPTQFDLILDIKGTDDFCTFPWSLLFDNRSFGGMTANFIQDDALQAELEACLSAETHSQETVDAFEQALEDNAYCYGLFTISRYVVAKAEKVSGFDYFSGTYLVPGGCTY